ncbi:uncharacterized protein LOC108679332, partial [Hyalella azteca]|uniref:Uncharacterized protein LOC108679332 n=1 Tax=Hyalella azteca TaxID=294128 RepID=A0A8B7PB92_HYAAZ
MDAMREFAKEELEEEHQNVDEYRPLSAASSVLVPAHAVPSSARTPAHIRPAPDLVADADTNVSKKNPPIVIVSVGSVADVAGPSGAAVRRNPTRSSGASYADSHDSGYINEDFVTNSLQIDLQ